MGSNHLSTSPNPQFPHQGQNSSAHPQRSRASMGAAALPAPPQPHQQRQSLPSQEAASWALPPGKPLGKNLLLIQEPRKPPRVTTGQLSGADLSSSCPSTLLSLGTGAAAHPEPGLLRSRESHGTSSSFLSPVVSTLKLFKNIYFY